MAAPSRVYVAGHRGLVSSAILRRLVREPGIALLTAGREALDLRDQAAVNAWFRDQRPNYVYLVAGTVGGILANATRPAEFIYDNIMIHAAVVHAAHVVGVRKLLYLGSSCIYPRACAQPMRKLLDVSRLHALGWRHTIELRDGLRSTYDWFLSHATVPCH